MYLAGWKAREGHCKVYTSITDADGRDDDLIVIKRLRGVRQHFSLII